MGWRTWKKVLPPQHILYCDDPNTILDVILGVLAVEEGDADLDDIAVDLTSMGRSGIESKGTLKALEGLASDRSLTKVDPTGCLPKPVSDKPRGKRSQRL